MSDVCPGCGAERNARDASTTDSWRCGAWQFRDGPHNPSPTCLTRQLAQRDERIKELEGQVKEVQQAFHDEYLAYEAPPGHGPSCGDNSCVQGNPPGHVGTNGGCRCTRTQLRHAIHRFRAHLAAIRSVAQMAMEWERADRRHREQQPKPGAGVYACLVAAQHVLAAEVRSLPDSEREWWAGEGV